MDIRQEGDKLVLYFPYSLTPDFLEFELPEFPVSKFVSATRIEWRSSLSCSKTDAELNLRWVNRSLECSGCFNTTPLDDFLICKIIECWDITRGELLSFKIADDHPMWELIPYADKCFKNIIKPFDSWVFKERPQITTDICGIYSAELNLIQKIDCCSDVSGFIS